MIVQVGDLPGQTQPAQAVLVSQGQERPDSQTGLLRPDQAVADGDGVGRLGQDDFLDDLFDELNDEIAEGAWEGAGQGANLAAHREPPMLHFEL